MVGDGSHPGAQLPGNADLFDAAGAPTIYAGATLGGQGTVAGITAAGGGTIAPGVVSPYSTLNATGNVQFNVGSLFNVNVNAAGQTDKLAVGGTATLTGGIVQVLAQPANYATTTNYTILTAGTRNSTTFAGVTSNSVFVTPTLSYPTQQEVVLTLDQPSRSIQRRTATPNQTAVANALNAGTPNALTALLFGQTSIAGAQQIFDALSGEVYGSVQNNGSGRPDPVRAQHEMLEPDAGRPRCQRRYLGAVVFGGDPHAVLCRQHLRKFAGPNDGARGGKCFNQWQQPRASARDVTVLAAGFWRLRSCLTAISNAALSTTFSGFLTGGDPRYGLLRAGLDGRLQPHPTPQYNVDARRAVPAASTARSSAPMPA